jgi:hypothetical protein
MTRLRRMRTAFPRRQQAPPVRRPPSYLSADRSKSVQNAFSCNFLSRAQHSESEHEAWRQERTTTARAFGAHKTHSHRVFHAPSHLSTTSLSRFALSLSRARRRSCRGRERTRDRRFEAHEPVAVVDGWRRAVIEAVAQRALAARPASLAPNGGRRGRCSRRWWCGSGRRNRDWSGCGSREVRITGGHVSILGLPPRNSPGPCLSKDRALDLASRKRQPLSAFPAIVCEPRRVFFETSTELARSPRRRRPATAPVRHRKKKPHRSRHRRWPNRGISCRPRNRGWC